MGFWMHEMTYALKGEGEEAKEIHCGGMKR